MSINANALQTVSALADTDYVIVLVDGDGFRISVGDLRTVIGGSGGGSTDIPDELDVGEIEVDRLQVTESVEINGDFSLGSFSIRDENDSLIISRDGDDLLRLDDQGELSTLGDISANDDNL